MVFSVIVPVYNVEQYLDKCVESVISQDYADFELLLINDGSSDSSDEICDKWAETDQRIKAIHRSNHGASAARNEGIEAASGKYLLFLDSDDYWLSATVLQAIADRIQITQPDVLILNLQKDFNGKLAAPYFRETLNMPCNLSIEEAETFVFENDLWTACAWNKVIKAELFQGGQLRFCEGITAEDIDWCYRLALSAKRFDFLNQNTVGYRQRINSITGSVSANKVQCLLNNIGTCVALSEGINSEKKKTLSGYLSYQYGTLLHGYAMLPESAEKKALFAPIQRLEYLLEDSKNAKTTLIRRVRNLLGLRMTIHLLALRASVQDCRK